ncbi:HAD-IIIC family phosphatase [Streptomyces carpaticus]|uniref:HAD-IIIC family phosphatase n=1 Tax=Streptomyces TaxID=1883 RepID=UPI0002DD0147|nr:MULTISPECIES: HAD-IIIC family phosphatase [Streptomyces]MCK1813965.1 HAD-IIIC family phosphatase [Streptomyces sp. XM4011]QKV67616.1 HAD-IIIC family phosphatase [Streptomyces harbinensis]UWM47904.1 HAD-IIIC family phosphatase [Streptomyces carpaticus]
MTGDGRGRVKCLVWDLDHTVWDGVLLEDGEVSLRPGVLETLRALDERGILLSVASRNDHEVAMRRLTELGIAEYFLAPQITWGPKSVSVEAVAKSLNIGIDALAFIDDQPFELEEVAFAHPQVLCVHADTVAELPGRPEFTPRFRTEDAARRREMYRSSEARVRAEESFEGAGEEFLSTLGMVFTIDRAQVSDLQRAEELTVRTNQLNSTGATYSYEELEALSASEDHLLLMAGLEDRFGSYGRIGLALVETAGPEWRLKLLLMSCRVMNRGVGTVLLHHVMRLARENGARLTAAFVPTDRNRVMYVTYRFAGFEETGRTGDALVLTAPDAEVPQPPPYLDLRIGG